MGTLGLAWTGDLKNAGGVCEKNGVSSTKQFRLDIFILFVSLLCDTYKHVDRGGDLCCSMVEFKL